MGFRVFSIICLTTQNTSETSEIYEAYENMVVHMKNFVGAFLGSQNRYAQLRTHRALG